MRYQLSVSHPVVYACHCRECQRQSGSAFALSLPVLRETLALTGALGIWHRAADSGARSTCSFCPVCGTRIHHASSGSPGWLTLKAGTLDDTSQIVIRCHIWVRSRQPWVVLDPVVPAFETQPADLAGWRRALTEVSDD